METTREAVKGKIHIWAVPRSEYEIKNSEDKLPFELKLSTMGHYYGGDDSVRIDTQEVTVYSPEGIDLVDAALQTLRDLMTEKKKEHQTAIDLIETKIKALLRIEHLPND
jgi:hypothetical protein